MVAPCDALVAELSRSPDLAPGRPLEMDGSRFVIEEKDVPVLFAAGSGDPAGDDMPGWSDITGNITVANPFGARIDFRTPVKNVTLKLNGQSVQP